MIKTINNWDAFKALRLDPKQKTTLINIYCHTVNMYMTILCFELMNNCINHTCTQNKPTCHVIQYKYTCTRKI